MASEGLTCACACMQTREDHATKDRVIIRTFLSCADSRCEGFADKEGTPQPFLPLPRALLPNTGVLRTAQAKPCRSLNPIICGFRVNSCVCHRRSCVLCQAVCLSLSLALSLPRCTLCLIITRSLSYARYIPVCDRPGSPHTLVLEQG
jgi:hypothetical protein